MPAFEVGITHYHFTENEFESWMLVQDHTDNQKT